MKNVKRNKFVYPATLIYVGLIVLINVAFTAFPIFQFLNSDISPMEPFAGIVYLVRDFAQRELGHYIFIAMFIGAALSYYFASPEIAFASVSAFLVGESIDWSIYSFTKRPLSQRLIWSSCLSAPVDSSIFLWGIHRFNVLAVLIMTLGKITGVVVVWYLWYRNNRSSTSAKEIKLPARDVFSA